MVRQKRSDKVFPLQVKIPVGLYESLKLDAVRNKSTLRDEVIARLFVKRTTPTEHSKAAKVVLEEVAELLSSSPVHAPSCGCILCSLKKVTK